MYLYVDVRCCFPDQQQGGAGLTPQYAQAGVVSRTLVRTDGISEGLSGVSARTFAIHARAHAQADGISLYWYIVLCTYVPSWSRQNALTKTDERTHAQIRWMDHTRRRRHAGFCCCRISVPDEPSSASLPNILHTRTGGRARALTAWIISAALYEVRDIVHRVHTR